MRTKEQGGQQKSIRDDNKKIDLYKLYYVLLGFYMYCKDIKRIGSKRKIALCRRIEWILLSFVEMGKRELGCIEYRRTLKNFGVGVCRAVAACAIVCWLSRHLDRTFASQKLNFIVEISNVCHEYSTRMQCVLQAHTHTRARALRQSIITCNLRNRKTCLWKVSEENTMEVNTIAEKAAQKSDSEQKCSQQMENI